MSKKLIAVASAAALALSALVMVPASATTVFKVETSADAAISGGTSADNALTVNVPSKDVLRIDDDTASALGFKATKTSATSTLVVKSTGSVKLLTSAAYEASGANVAKTSTGVTEISDANSATVVFYAYTTSTSAGTITVENSGNSRTIFIKGVSPKKNGYKLELTAPATAGIGAEVTLTASVKDMFGNNVAALATASQTDLVLKAVGGNVTATPTMTTTFSSVTNLYTIKFTSRNDAGAVAASLELGADAKADKVDAFGDPVQSAFFSLNTVDLATQVTALTAQVAALQAQMADMRTKARSVTKKRYNTLARKWNAANPSARVALKK